MSHKFARKLDNQDQVEHFLIKVLEMKIDVDEMDSIASKIISGEKGLLDLKQQSQTLNSTEYRNRKYKDDADRTNLHIRIVDELLKLPRPTNDDDIKLGKGGAQPKNGIKNRKQAYIIIGLPASGKSNIANAISDNYQALILDADYAKRKLPEYDQYDWGATIVHEESDHIIFGESYDFKSLMKKAVETGANMVIPKIGQSVEKILTLAKMLKNGLNYDVHLTLVSLLKKDATIRAIKRFKDTRRYVPLGLIFDGYGNDPCLTYHLIKNKAAKYFSSFGAISTNVKIGESPIAIDCTQGNPAELYPLNEKVLI